MAMRFAIVFVVGCVLPPPQGQPGYAAPPQQGQPYAPQPQEQPVAASCQQTLGCYGQCNPLTPACMQACDQQSSPANVELAHGVVTCVATSGCADQACSVQRCSAQLTSCTSAAAVATAQQQQQQQPAAQGPTGGLDLQYQMPAGWHEEHLLANATTLAFGQTKIFILPSRPLSGSIIDMFHAIWNEQLAASYELVDALGPLRRRLASGYAMALDGGGAKVRANNGFSFIALYLVYTADRVVPIVAINLDASQEPVLARFFDGVAIRGAPATNAPLFDPGELVGHWSSGATSAASYVDASGRVTGDASVAVGETYNLEADGTFRSHLIGVTAGGAAQDNGAGRWRIEDDILVLEAAGRTTRKRIWGHGTSPKGAPNAICLRSFGTDQPKFSSPKDGYNTAWYGHVQ